MKVLRCIKSWIVANSSPILMILGIVTTVAAVIFAILATARSVNEVLIASDMAGHPLNGKEILKLVWKHYIPVVLCLMSSIISFIGVERIHIAREVALGAALTATEETLVNYKNITRANVGTKKEDAIEKEAAQTKAEASPDWSSLNLVEGSGPVLIFDSMFGGWTRSSREAVGNAFVTANEELTSQDALSLSELRSLLSLPSLKFGDEIEFRKRHPRDTIHHRFIPITDPVGNPALALEYELRNMELSNAVYESTGMEFVGSAW